MKKSFINAMAAALVSLLAVGCGGGLTSSSEDTSKPAVFQGAYRTVDTLTTCMMDYVQIQPGGSPSIVQAQGYNELAFGSDNTGYRICAHEIWVGKFTGVFDNGIGTGTTNMTVFQNGGGPIRQAGLTTGAIFNDSSGHVMNFTLKNALDSESNLVSTDQSVNRAYFNSIAGSYETLTGSYYALSQQNQVSIKPDGSLFGTSLLGLFSGNITAFHADTQVHDISLTVNAQGAAPRTLKGVIAPYGAFGGRVPSELPGSDWEGGIMLIVTDNNVAWGDVFSKRK